MLYDLHEGAAAEMFEPAVCKAKTRLYIHSSRCGLCCPSTSAEWQILQEVQMAMVFFELQETILQTNCGCAAASDPWGWDPRGCY